MRINASRETECRIQDFVLWLLRLLCLLALHPNQCRMRRLGTRMPFIDQAIVPCCSLASIGQDRSMTYLGSGYCNNRTVRFSDGRLLGRSWRWRAS